MAFVVASSDSSAASSQDHSGWRSGRQYERVRGLPEAPEEEEEQRRCMPSWRRSNVRSMRREVISLDDDTGLHASSRPSAVAAGLSPPQLPGRPQRLGPRSACVLAALVASTLALSLICLATLRPAAFVPPAAATGEGPSGAGPAGIDVRLTGASGSDDVAAEHLAPVPRLRAVRDLAEESDVAVADTHGSSSEGLRSTENGRPKCDAMEEDVEFWTAKAIYEMEFVTSSAMCKAKCENVPDCRAWTWGRAGSGPQSSEVCFLRGLGDGERIWRLPRRGLISGVPCHSKSSDGEGQQLARGKKEDGRDERREKHEVERKESGEQHTEEKHKGTNFTDNHNVEEAKNPVVTFQPGSLLCFCLFVPGSYEQGLLTMQYNQGASIFGCDEYDVYTNKSFELVPGVLTRKVDSDLHCELGGKYQTALNNGIFMKVWSTVVGDRRYLNHDWTVKVDADSVFFPDRLRPLVREHSDGGNSGAGVYLNNCQFGLHGPVEVFSRNAVTVWGEKMHHCRAVFHRQCSGSCLWGEDMFIDQCLWKVLKSRREDDFRILMEDHCAPPPGWNACTDPTVAAFHPFKSQDGYLQCLHSAWAIRREGNIQVKQ